MTWWMPWVLWIAGEVVLVMALAETLKRLALKPDPARWARWRWTMRAPSILLALLGTLYSPVYASAGLLDSPVGCMPSRRLSARWRPCCTTSAPGCCGGKRRTRESANY